MVRQFRDTHREIACGVAISLYRNAIETGNLYEITMEEIMGRSGTVCVLGAGASVEAGYPLAADFGRQFEDLIEAEGNREVERRKSFAEQLENREQTELELVCFNPTTGHRSTLLRETSDVWINLHHLFKPLKHPRVEDGGSFIWASERTGFRHLYLYRLDRLREIKRHRPHLHLHPD